MCGFTEKSTVTSERKEVSMVEIIKCPVCRKRIFDLEWQGQTVIKIKCPHCRNVVVIKRKTEEVNSNIALK